LYSAALVLIPFGERYFGWSIMDYRITAEERTRFKRCRRQWDLASPHRRDLQPADIAPGLAEALKDALAVYYYPGTWDWPRELTLSLVGKAFDRSARESGLVDPVALDTGARLLAGYDGWARALDDFAPVKIDHDLEALVPDPRDPDRGLLAPDGSRVVYAGRVDLLAVDATDAYWVVRHRLVPEWQDLDALLLDEEAVAMCWAWEQVYLGMEVAGTIHNELRTTDLPAPASKRRLLRRVAQHEASGGGRSIPQHRRMYARPMPTAAERRAEQQSAGALRRTRIRRTRDEIGSTGRMIGVEAVEMLADPAAYPTPGPHCAACEFTAPCLAMTEGADPEPLLAQSFRHRSQVTRPRPRLGQTTWSTGRGAAPPPEW
ncbi:MAG: hypothetical protein LC635_00525, partial [Pseudonocardiaceae bacterium]|nr:hypothetical protein [Pseudonocardiaceae bacterium]